MFPFDAASKFFLLRRSTSGSCIMTAMAIDLALCYEPKSGFADDKLVEQESESCLVKRK